MDPEKRLGEGTAPRPSSATKGSMLEDLPGCCATGRGHASPGYAACPGGLVRRPLRRLRGSTAEDRERIFVIAEPRHVRLPPQIRGGTATQYSVLSTQYSVLSTQYSAVYGGVVTVYIEGT